MHLPGKNLLGNDEGDEKMRIAVFGGAGFIGSHFVDLLLKKNNVEKVLVLDGLTYAGNLENLKTASLDNRFSFKKADIVNPTAYNSDFADIDLVVNFAAESHVDRSIENPDKFMETNALGVVKLLNVAMASGVKKFLQVSTDEVYGSVPLGESNESTILNPSSPYSSSKAAGELVALSYWTTYKFPVIVTRGCNTYGPRQFPEKLIPLAIKKLKSKQRIPIYGDGEQIREWIHVEDHAAGIYAALVSGLPGEIYNIGSGIRLTNNDLLHKLLPTFGMDTSSLEYVADRKGHDSRYALDSQKIRKISEWRCMHDINRDLKSADTW
jgi:dTDP-glucose 4,6-dehydratase